MEKTTPSVRLRRALLIDDDSVAQFVNRLIIEQLHLVEECILHSNGATALQLLKHEQAMGLPLPDVIVLDLNMPVMGGLEFLEYLNEGVELSALLKRTLVLTSSDSSKDLATVSKLGARWYLTKPLLSETLSPILTTLLNERAKSVG
jgi:CheY-like chemotaxis protein